MLYRQPSSKGPARKSWEATLGLRYFGPAKVVKERVGGERAADFVLTAQVKKKRLMVTWSTRCKKVSKTASNGAQTAAIVPEMTVVLETTLLWRLDFSGRLGKHPDRTICAF
jgi:hypothetical protein